MTNNTDKHEIDRLIWQAFSRATWLQKYFSFNFKEQYKEQFGQGTKSDTNNAL